VECGEKDDELATLTLRLPELRNVDNDVRCSRTNLIGRRPRASRAAATAALASTSDVEALLTGGEVDTARDCRSSVLTIGSTTAFAARDFALETAPEGRSILVLSTVVEAHPECSVADNVDGGLSDVGDEPAGRRDPPRNVRNVLIRDVILDVTSAVDMELSALATMFCGSETSVARVRGDENGRGPEKTPKYDDDDDQTAVSSSATDPQDGSSTDKA